MDKLELDLDDLTVDSFQPNSEQEEKRGTVQGNERGATWQFTCDGDTCYYTCYCEPIEN
jgi:hypothetical protein